MKVLSTPYFLEGSTPLYHTQRIDCKGSTGYIVSQVGTVLAFTETSFNIKSIGTLQLLCWTQTSEYSCMG